MKVGITFSAFDLLHAGHIAMLRDSKDQCDYLVAGLQLDPTIDRPEKNKPVQTIVERYTQLKGVKYVDEIIPYTTEKDVEENQNIVMLTQQNKLQFQEIEQKDKEISDYKKKCYDYEQIINKYQEIKTCKLLLAKEINFKGRKRIMDICRDWNVLNSTNTLEEFFV